MTTAPLPPLAITALSPVAAGASFCRLAGVLWATVIVKATFQLVHGEPARLIAAEDLVTSDRASGSSGSLTHARETVPHLLNVGVVLTGHACAPDGRAVPSMSVRLGVSRDRPVIDKTLHVFGARAVANPGAISPFQRMPLVYERANGGAGTWENPVGTGGPGSRVLPNIVDPKDPRKVAGFGPLSPQWAPRRALLRGMDPSALEAPIWDVPAGFDWRFFQAAPQDQQIDKLHGDEWIVLDGMDTARPRVESRLPVASARARKDVHGVSAGSAGSDIDLRADMLVIDADRRVASLIWRGRFAVESSEALSRTTVLVGLDLPGRPIAWRTVESPNVAVAAASLETQEVNLRALLGASVPFAPGRDSHLPSPSPVARPEAKFTGTEAVDLRAILRGSVPFGAALETTALPATRETGPVTMAETTALPAFRSAELAGVALRVSEPAAAVLSTVDAVRVPAVEVLPFKAEDPARSTTASVTTPAAPRASRLVTGTTDIHLGQLLQGVTPFERRDEAGAAALVPPLPVAPVPLPPLPQPVHAPPTLPDPPSLRGPLAPVPASPLSASAPEGRGVSGVPPPTGEAARRASGGQECAPAPVSRAASLAAGNARARVLDKLQRKELLDGDDLAGANLSGLDLSGCSFVRCNLRGAKLRGTKLRGAKLTHAILDEADLRGAHLDGADLTDASLLNANLEQASLTNCTAERGDFQDARLRGADLTEARLTHASLKDVTMRDVRANKLDITGARLDRAFKALSQWGRCSPVLCSKGATSGVPIWRMPICTRHSSAEQGSPERT